MYHAGEVEEEEEEDEEEKAGDSWLNELNPNSRTVLQGCMANIHLANAKPGDRHASCSASSVCLPHNIVDMHVLTLLLLCT